MHNFLDRIAATVVPLIGVVIFIAFLIISIVFFSYVFIILAVIGLVLFIIGYIRVRIFLYKQAKQRKKTQKGRTINHE